MATSTIKDQRGRVQMLLNNRSDLAVIQAGDPAPFDTHPKIDEWVWQSYLDMAMDIQFEDLEIGPVTSVTPDDGITQYQPFPDDARAVKQISLDVGMNGKFIPIRGPVNINLIRRTAGLATGAPSRWARWNYKCWFDLTPDQPYPFQMMYWQKPVQVVDSSNATSDIEDTPLLMPDDWIEILNNMAALRGFQFIQDEKKMIQTQRYLHGDPAHPERPGIIKIKLQSRDAEKDVAEYAIQPVRQQYTFTR